MSQTKKATLYRMVMDEHLCPFGVRAWWLLKWKGYTIEDHHLTSRKETDAFKQKHDVKTTPQTFIEGKRIGGYDDLKRYFGYKIDDGDTTTYQPVIALFAFGFAMSLAIGWLMGEAFAPVHIIERFIALSMCLLALQKLKDVSSFASQFLGYDLLARRFFPYAYVYPFAEGLAGLLMLAMALNWVSIPVALFIGTVGAISVFKAVYIDKRELKCACVGGNSNVPLGFVSLTENLMMVAMAIWMLIKNGGIL